MDEVLAAVVALGNEGKRGALSSLVWSSGSVPMSERAKMLVGEDGRILGTIGGGCLEAEILTVSQRVIQRQQAALSRFTLTEEQAGAGGLNCGGSLSVLTEPVAGQTLYTTIQVARRERRACALLSLLAGPAAEVPHLLVAPGRAVEGSLGSSEFDQWATAQATALLARGTGDTELLALGPEWTGGERGELFIEPYLPPPRLFVVGGGHVGAQVCRLAAHVGFEVVVVDDRPRFANAQRHPDAHQCVVAPLDQVFSQLPVDGQSYVLAATRGHEHDEVVVEAAIRTPARYVGMLGSERKKLLMWERIAARGGDRQRLEQVFAPVGLDIGADTPEEIAVSVVAELVQVRRGGGKHWKTKTARPGDRA
ncbi:MAG: XdhC family protein [Candidatus Latescibacteria bacterium]|nr:XdhC family protein [Candidatus Latescibacterota bacterium]